MRRRLRALLAQFPAPERIGKPDRYEILRAVVRRVAITADCLVEDRTGSGPSDTPRTNLAGATWKEIVMGNRCMQTLALIAMLQTTGTSWGATNVELAEQVRVAETAFAKSLADRKLDAFESFVSDEAIFYSREDVQRGKAAVIAAWKGFFAGEQAPFSWAPASVQVLDSGTLALSSGPVRDPEGKQIGTFNSIWRLESDGHWRVVFDKGCPFCGE